MNNESDRNVVSPIDARIGLSHGMLPANTPGKLWAVISLSANKEVTGSTGSEPGSRRLPLNISMVLDRSGSMRGNPIDQVKQAAKFLVEQMGAEDFASLTVFDSDVEVVFPSQHVTNKDLLKGAIELIRANGSTNLSGGLLRGYAEALKECRDGQVNRVMLLTDGMANVGITDSAALASKVHAMLEKNVSLSTIGVGLNFDEDLLIAQAEAGNGSYYYVKDADDIPGVFATELEGLLSVVAQGITLKVDGLSGCQVTAVYGYEPSFAGGGVSLSLPDMFADEEKRLVIEFTYPALPAGDHPVMSMNLAYADAMHGLANTSLGITATLTAAADASQPQEPDFDVLSVVEIAKTAMEKDEIAEVIDKGDYDDARARLQERLTTLNDMKRSGRLAYSKPLNKEIDYLESMIGRLSEAPDAFTQSEMRKDLRSQSYRTRRNQGDYPGNN